MPLASQLTVAPRVRRVAVTIPASSGDAVTIRSLLESTLSAEDMKVIIGGKVNAAAADYTAGDSDTSLPLTITAGDAYTEPTVDFLSATYVKASANATVAAVVSVWLDQPNRM